MLLTVSEDAVEKIKSLTDGHGVDFAVDTTGVKKVMEDSIQALAQGGTSACIAVTPNHVDLDTWNDLCVDDRKVIGVNMGDAVPQIDIPRLIKFYQRHVRLRQDRKVLQVRSNQRS